MANYESVKEETRKFGRNSYVEVSRKRLLEDGHEATEFVLVTRGFFDRDGTKKWTRFVTLPDEPEVRTWLAEALAKL